MTASDREADSCRVIETSPPFTHLPLQQELDIDPQPVGLDERLHRMDGDEDPAL